MKFNANDWEVNIAERRIGRLESGEVMYRNTKTGDIIQLTIKEDRHKTIDTIMGMIKLI